MPPRPRPAGRRRAAPGAPTADLPPVTAVRASGGTVGAADATKPGDTIVASATTRTAVRLTRSLTPLPPSLVEPAASVVEARDRYTRSGARPSPAILAGCGLGPAARFCGAHGRPEPSGNGKYRRSTGTIGTCPTISRPPGCSGSWAGCSSSSAGLIGGTSGSSLLPAHRRRDQLRHVLLLRPHRPGCGPGASPSNPGSCRRWSRSSRRWQPARACRCPACTTSTSRNPTPSPPGATRSTPPSPSPPGSSN